jgi:hypothetical protein
LCKECYAFIVSCQLLAACLVPVPDWLLACGQGWIKR